MEALYVCLFSNGHIKVGRSNEPATRVKQHEDRVACMGVALSVWGAVDCPANVINAELLLIERCTKHASQRFKNEWFTGLEYVQVTEWAHDAVANAKFTTRVTPSIEGAVDFIAICRALKLAGFTQTDLATLCGIKQSSMSDIANGVTRDPGYSVGAKLVELYVQEVGQGLEGTDERRADSLVVHGAQFCSGEPLNATQRN